MSYTTSNTAAMITFDELKAHNQSTDCWIVVHDRVYDVSAFLDEHPGGAESPLPICVHLLVFVSIC
jgi:cytochrome b involved in lipid metabolism